MTSHCGAVGGCAYYADLGGPGGPWRAKFAWGQSGVPLVIDEGLPSALLPGEYVLMLSSFLVSDVIVNNERPHESLDATCWTEFSVVPGQEAIIVRGTFGADECSVETFEGGDEIALWTASAPTMLDGQEVCRLALGGGELARHSESGLGVKNRLGEVRPIVWPFGYTARQEGDGVVLVDRAGDTVAREGDLVQFGGGLNVDGVFAACGGVEVVQIGN